MKLYKIASVILVLLFMGACSKGNSIYELPKPIKIHEKESALSIGEFTVKTDDSWMIIKMLKNEKIPAKGTFNVKAGSFSLKNEDNINALITLDAKSWDSGLNERDELILKHILGVGEGSANDILLTFKIDKTDLKNLLKDAGQAQNILSKGKIEFKNKDHVFEVPLLFKINAEGLLLVQTEKEFNIKLSEMGLSKNIQKYKDIRKIESIRDEVELSFMLKFYSLK